MMETELVFPPHLIPTLRDLHGEKWAALVDRILALPETAPDFLAFMLTVARLTHCDTCTPMEFRALRGCAYCAPQAIKRFRGSEEDLLQLYARSQRDVQKFLKGAKK